MPIYEYKCENDHVFDVMQKMSDAPLSECQVCGAPARKLLSPVGISFKGSGFYSTDYSKKGPKPESKESTKDGSASNGSSGEASSGNKSSEKTTSTEKTAKKGD